MIDRPVLPLATWIVRADGVFLALAGGAGMAADTAGHFLGIGPLGATLGSAYTIGGFEAHGLAVIIGLFMLRSGSPPTPRLWHWFGWTVHLLLGAANLIFWKSFEEWDLIVVGVVTTVLHGVFVGLHSVCLLGSRTA